METRLRYLPAIGTVLIVVVLLVALLWGGPRIDWSSAAALVFIAAFAFAVAATLRYAVGAAEPDVRPPGADGDTLLRSRLAPLVIGIGTIGILVVAGAVIWGVSLIREPRTVDPSVYLGIFSSVVPVFATWVGAVIAFYFTNESFRQAAEASGATKGDPSDSEPITSPTRMIPFEKITHYELKPKDDGTGLEDPGGVDFSAIKPLFSATVSRIIILDPNKRPVRIVRQKLVPADMPDDAKLSEYFVHDQNASDAINFKTIPETSTVGEARAVAKLYKLADLFVTKTGGAEEPILGWVPDDRLR
ncbi:MAG TPA: hypothetical protein VIN06_17225 [Devosia sp.]